MTTTYGCSHENSHVKEHLEIWKFTDNSSKYSKMAGYIGVCSFKITKMALYLYTLPNILIYRRSVIWNQSTLMKAHMT